MIFLWYFEKKIRDIKLQKFEEFDIPNTIDKKKYKNEQLSR